VLYWSVIRSPARFVCSDGWKVRWSYPNNLAQLSKNVFVNC
jgi:hypothetical protein